MALLVGAPINFSSVDISSLFGNSPNSEKQFGGLAFSASSQDALTISPHRLISAQ